MIKGLTVTVKRIEQHQQATDRRLEALEAVRSRPPSPARGPSLQAPEPVFRQLPVDISSQGLTITVFGPRDPAGPTALQREGILYKVRELLPRAITDDDLDLSCRPEENCWNKITWKTEHTLARLPDPANLGRIQAIQDEFVESRLPPNVWLQRLLYLLQWDFQVIRTYLEENVKTTWIKDLILLCERLLETSTPALSRRHRIPRHSRLRPVT